MADMDSGLPALTDGNPSSTWSSYGFGSPAFGGVVKEFGLAAKLESPTVVSKLTIQQTGGSGGSFTVYTNNQASMSGATEVGKGSFSGQDVTVELDKDKQSADKGGYIIIVFDEAPKLSQPIAGYSYGLRIGGIEGRVAYSLNEWRILIHGGAPFILPRSPLSQDLPTSILRRVQP